MNNNDVMPASTNRFNSYNQPALNADGLVVFRARSRGEQGGPPTRGIYLRRMGPPHSGNNPIEIVLNANSTAPTLVPQPNNTGAGFTEFPSVPRIDAHSDLIASRGQSQPVWRYTLPDGAETRVGTTGIYTRHDSSGAPFTAASLLGAVPGFGYFAVAGVEPATRFDVFPGAPSPTTAGLYGKIAFKGNWTEGVQKKTGVFYRNLTSVSSDRFVHVVASTDTPIPNGSSSVTFGSTSPPSAYENQMVFVGLDNEDEPTEGGIYLAPLSPNPTLTVLVGFGAPVPGVTGAQFNRFGEALSFDGRFVSFWGAWGGNTRTLTLICPTEGNRDRLQFCNDNYPDGFDVDVPVHQGFFVVDVDTGKMRLVAQTGERFIDFLYWNFTGSPQGEDSEPPRWRASAYSAVAATGPTARIVFKARSASYAEDAYEDVIDSIVLGRSPGFMPLMTVVDTTTDGRVLDPDAPADSTVSEPGIERDAFRGRWLALTARFGTEEEEGLAGIYITRTP